MELDVFCLGEPLIEFYQIHDEVGKIYHTGFGGDTSNTAISIARQGMTAGFLSIVGNDHFGRDLLELWKREKVDCSHVSIHPEANTGIYFITHDDEGHHFTYYRSASAASKIKPSNIPSFELVQFSVLHFSAITQAISESSCETALAAVHQARKVGAKVSYDTNLRLNLWPIESAKDIINSTIPLCDVLLPSLEDVYFLTGLSNPESIIDYFLKLGANLVVLKQGALGVRVSDGRDSLHISGHSVNTIDATGAGDTFNGAFLSEWLRHDDPFAAAEYANAAAALSTTKYGAVNSIPISDEVSSFLGYSI